MPLFSSATTTTTSSDSNDFFPSSSDDLLLLCGEDAGALDDGADESADLPGLVFPLEEESEEEEEEGVMTALVEAEGNYTVGSGYRPCSLDPSFRRRAVDWILKVYSYYNFHPLTAYLAINYMDRFLSSHILPQQPTGWPMQLLSVTCLSLAAKMEETLVPSLLDLQVEDARFIFEPRTICRMELLVLTALNWRLRSVTPFSFIDSFARKAGGGTGLLRRLTSRAFQVILKSITDTDILKFQPSTIAAAAVVFASDGIPGLSFIDPGIAGSWCPRLATGDIVNCYQLMREVMADDRQREKSKPVIFPSLRMAGSTIKMNTVTSSSSCSSSSSNKRRKLNNCLWVEDDKEMP